MKKIHQMRFYWLISAILLLAACKKENNNQEFLNDQLQSETESIDVPDMGETIADINSKRNECNTFYGPIVQIGNGHARSWVNISKSGNKPKALGIEFTANAFNNLPTDPLNFAANTYFLTLHQKAKALTAFDHITLNWEPEGHEPPGIYDVPHFDMHFYKITIAQQLAISPVPGPAPAAGYLPAEYVIQGASVPQMGTHWLNPASPELPPSSMPFTHTFIYGSANGQVHFLEPMITKAFLLSGTSVSKYIPQPIHFAPSNKYYPTYYKIWKKSSNNRHYVALTHYTFQ